MTVDGVARNREKRANPLSAPKALEFETKPAAGDCPSTIILFSELELCGYVSILFKREFDLLFATFESCGVVEDDGADLISI